MHREVAAVNKGSKYCICTMQSVVRCKMKRSDPKDDIVHAIYCDWEEVSRVCSNGEVVVGISRNLMKCTF